MTGLYLLALALHREVVTDPYYSTVQDDSVVNGLRQATIGEGFLEILGREPHTSASLEHIREPKFKRS